MQTIKQTYHIKAPVKTVWQALVDPKYIEAWGGGPAKMNDQEGSKFSLWGGDIYGKNLEVVPEKKLVQQWTEGDWQSPSTVTFTLHSEKNGTRLELTHKDVPASSLKSIDEGWKAYYLGLLKEYTESLKQ